MIDVMTDMREIRLFTPYLLNEINCFIHGKMHMGTGKAQRADN